MIYKRNTRILLGLAVAFTPISMAQAQDASCLACHTSNPATLANLIVEDVDGCDYTDADLFDGWGWNRVLQESCAPLTSETVASLHEPDNSAQTETAPSACDYTSADLFDGWGWNPITGQSCAPVGSSINNTSSNNTSSNNTSSNNTTNSNCIDPDGDGWGWDGSASCRVTGSANNTNSTPGTDASCIDTAPIGDGWGWNGSASCRVADAGNNVVSTPDTNASCIDTPPLGDGWGWNGSSSCRVGIVNNDPEPEPVTSPNRTTPVADSVFVSSTNPVRSTGNSFFPDRGPQCVWPANQFNGPGLGYGNFLMVNNAWNGDKSTHEWLQCIALTEVNGQVNPSWTYDWGNEDDLKQGFREWEVKTYPEILFGIKEQSVQSGTFEETGLPVTYSQMPDFTIDYSYRTTQTNNRIGDLGDENNNPARVTGGERNVAIESFLHTSCDIRRGADSNRAFELMVWLDKGAERRPSGRPPVAVYTDSFGINYDVYVKGADDPGYIAYVAQQSQTTGTLNWNEFFADAQSNAGTYGVNRIDNNWCLGNILFGTEIWWGEGSMQVDRYEITRRY